MLKKIILSFIAILLLVFFSLVAFFFYPTHIGSKAVAKEFAQYRKYPNFDEAYGGFVNQNKDVIKKMLNKSSEWDSFIEYYWPTTIVIS